MSKVDYSEFFYKNFADEEQISKIRQPKIRERKPKRKIVFRFIVVLALIACLVSVTLLIDSLTGKALANKVNELIEGKNYKYYFVAKTYATREAAYAQSLLIRQSGASGYIYAEENQHVTVYALYFTLEEAEKVAEKNDAEVKKLSPEIKDEELYSELDYTVSVLVELSVSLELGTIYETQLKEKLSTVTARLEKQNLRLAKQEKQDSVLLALSELALGGVSSLSGEYETRVNLLANIRYVATSIVLNM